VGHGGEGFDVSPDGKQIWVANAQDGTVSIVDIASKRVVDTLAPNFREANRLKFTPNGKLVFISASDLVILDAATHKEIKHLDPGCGGGGIQMAPDGSRAYAACNRKGYVAAIDVKTLKVIGQIDAGGEPDGLAWAIRQ
jgi:YVTN family beta-propeller protein